MKEYVIKEGIKLILIWEISRLSRKMSVLVKEIQDFADHNVNIFALSGGHNTLVNGKLNYMLVGFISGMVQMERDNFIDRGKRGRLASVAAGKSTGYAIMPYGYKNVEGKLTIDEEESIIIEEIFDKVGKGIGPSTIVTSLNARGVQTRHRKRGKKRVLKNGKEVDRVWKITTINSILHNELYKGVRTFGADKTKLKAPAIVSEEIWDKAQEYFKDNLGYHQKTKYTYLFKGKIRCGSCKNKYGSRTENRYVNLKQYYYCYGQMDLAIKCRNGQFKSSVLDKYVYDLLFRHEQIMVNIYKDSAKDFSIEDKENEIEFYKEQILKEGVKRKRVIQLYKEGEIDDDEYRSDIESVRNKTVGFENDINITKKEIKLFSEKEIDNIERFKELKNEDDFSVKREFVDKYINEIFIYRVSDNKIDFTKLVHWELGIDSSKPVMRKLRNPNNLENLMYLEVFAFGNKNPVKVVLSSLTNICYSSDKLQYQDGVLESN